MPSKSEYKRLTSMMGSDLSETQLKLWEEGYLVTNRIEGHGLCGVLPMAFTYGLMLGLTETGYESRYCYEHRDDAIHALAIWDGTGDPPGPWIKHKGLKTGERIGPGATDKHANV